MSGQPSTAREFLKAQLEALYAELYRLPTFIPVEQIADVEQREYFLRAEIARLEKQLENEEITQPSMPAVTTATPAITDEYVFKRCGDGWFIRAFGEEGYFKNLNGLLYIARLIEAKSEPVLMQVLVGGCLGKVSPEEAKAEGLYTDTTQQPLIDCETLVDLGRRIKEVKQAIEDAERKGDAVEAAWYRKELENLLDERKELTRPTGQSKTFPSDIDKLRIRIANAIRRACDVLRAGDMPRTAGHFEVACYAEGKYYRYRPDKNPEWIVN